MSAPSRVPVEWPAEWTAPETLARLEATPVNCLLLAQRATDAFRTAAQAQRIELVEPGDARLPWRLLKEVDWSRSAAPIAIKDGFWPQITTRRADTDSAGPTGAAWLDANAWILRMAHGRAPGREVWLRSAAPQDARSMRDDAFLLPVLEAGMYGAQRPFWAPAARWSPELLGRLGRCLGWQRERGQWAHWTPVARLLVMSDFAGPNEYMASEVLTLAARRNLPFAAVEPRALGTSSLSGRKAVLALDPQPPAAAALALLRRFVEGGGTLICQRRAAGGLLAGLQPGAEANPRFEVYRLGRGRLAISRQDWDDPWILSGDAHLLMSRRWDAVRLFNPGSIGVHHTASPDLRRWVIQLLNYSLTSQGHALTLQALARVRSARVHLLDQDQPAPLQPQPATVHPEFALPAFPLLAAVELEMEPEAPAA